MGAPHEHTRLRIPVLGPLGEVRRRDQRHLLVDDDTLRVPRGPLRGIRGRRPSGNGWNVRPSSRRALLRQAIECLLAGDVDTGKAILRDYINGTIGFEELSDRTHTPAKSLMRMFGPKGNPQAKNLFDVIATLQQAEGVQFQVR